MRTASLSLAAAVTLTAIALAPAAPAGGQSSGLDAPTAESEAARRPFVIRRPGSYRLPDTRRVGDITAIEIASGDVTLDLGGHGVIGPGGRRGVGIAIRGVSNVRVFNGHLQNLAVGVLVEDATNVTIEGLAIDGQDSGGSPPDVEIGILLVETRGARVTGNVITDTFLGVFVRGEESGGNRIAENLITGGANGELAICYNPADGASAGGPDGDLVYGNVLSHFRRGIAFSADSTGNVARGNTVAFFDVAVEDASAGGNVIAENDEVQIAP